MEKDGRKEAAGKQATSVCLCLKGMIKEKRNEEAISSA